MRTRKITYILLLNLMVAASLLLISPSANADQVISAGRVNFGVVGEAEFDAGYVLVPSVPVFWESEVPWRMTVRSLNPDLGVSENSRYVKSLSDLRWRLSDGQAWLPLRQDTEEVDWSTQTGSGVIYIDIVILLDWLKDAPGEYRTDVVFTIESL